MSSLVEVLQILNYKLLAASFALCNLHIVPLRFVLHGSTLVGKILVGHFTLLMLAIIVLMEVVNLIMLGDIPVCFIIVTELLAGRRGITLLALTHRLGKCLVDFVTAEVVAPCASKLR